MNLEGIVLRLSADYLSDKIIGTKISRVFMPHPHTVALILKKHGETVPLLLDIKNGRQAVYIPETLPDNPEIPPAFCMLLRKHLEGGRITAVVQKNLDRVITLEVDMLGSGGKIITKSLLAELTGKNANIILVSEGVVLDALKHVGVAQNSYRNVQPGVVYTGPPPQSGFNILTAAPSVIAAAVGSCANETAFALVKVTLGIGKATALALTEQAGISQGKTTLSCCDVARLAEVIGELQTGYQRNGVILYALIGRDNRVKNIVPLRPPTENLSGTTMREFGDINEAIRYAVSLTPVEMPLKEKLQRIVAGESVKLEKKLHALREDLDKAENAEEQKIFADTLMANLYTLRKGMSSANLVNIYDGEDIEVKMDPLLTPSDNAQEYYKRYAKYKRAQGEIKRQLLETKTLLEYLATIDGSLLSASTKVEFEEIAAEMEAAGFFKRETKKKKISHETSQPLKINLGAETAIYVGKNNRQNDFVTFTIGSGKDLWFHTKDIPGSHVVLKTSLPVPREEDISIAVQFAAFFSKAVSESNVPVDCTERRFVKKPSGSKPGFVIYTNQKTYYATPSEALINKYK